MVKSFKRITVLVTGANGFIGSHIARRLVYLGARVSIFVEPRISLWRIKDIIDRVKLYRIDITDYEKIKKLIKRIRPVKIYHLAAHVDVDRSVGLIDSMIDVNLKGTMNILKALKTNNIKFDCFINTGTCEEYGDGKTPFLETQRESPVSPYSASKVCVTYFCQMLYKTEGMPVVTLRPFLTYGPYQANNMLIPSLIEKCLLGEPFKATKGEQTRDFNYISDIVNGYIKASITEKAVGEIINLGTGKEYKIKDIIDLIVRLTSASIKPEIGKLPYREGEAMHFYCSNNKAKRLLNWQPQVSIEKGLHDTIIWYKKYLKRRGCKRGF